jgi:hypothetical protein
MCSNNCEGTFGFVDTVKAYWEAEVWVEVSGLFCAPPVYTEGKSLWYPLSRRLSKPTASLVAVEERKISCLY